MARRFVTPLLMLLLTTLDSSLLRGSEWAIQHEDEGKSTKLAGEVRYYEPGKKIGIGIRPQVEKTYDLSSKDTTFLLDPDVQVGSKVEMEEKKDENGKKLVIIRIKI